MEHTAFWETFSEIRKMYGIPVRQFREYVSLGYIRKVKMGKKRNSKALFNMQDIDDLMNCLASGKTPRVKRGNKC